MVIFVLCLPSHMNNLHGRRVIVAFIIVIALIFLYILYNNYTISKFVCITKSHLNNLSCSSSSSSSSAMCKYTEEGLWVCLSGSSAGEYTRVTSVEHASHLLREKKVLFCINVLVLLTHTQELVFFLVYNLIIANNCTVHNASRRG